MITLIYSFVQMQTQKLFFLVKNVQNSNSNSIFFNQKIFLSKSNSALLLNIEKQLKNFQILVFSFENLVPSKLNKIVQLQQIMHHILQLIVFFIGRRIS